MATPLVLLHGFAATARHWDSVTAVLPGGRFEPIALNLTDADPQTPDGVLELVASATAGSEPFVLAGYSMGGRLALHVALAIPDRVTRLVLLSTSAGIDDPAQRAERRRDDEALARAIERGTIEEFIARWRAVPLFACDPADVHDAAAADERRNAPADLAAMLRGFGPGVMEPVWERLGELQPDVAVLVGERDERYRELGQRLAAGLPHGELEVVAGAGHRLALQAPDAVAAALAGA